MGNEAKEEKPYPQRYYPAIYGTLYPMMAKAARKVGYALALHGSLGRDMDCVAVAWTEDAVNPEELVSEMLKATCGLLQSEAGPTKKPHGRLSWNIEIGAGGYVDLSIIPPKEST